MIVGIDILNNIQILQIETHPYPNKVLSRKARYNTLVIQ